MHENMEDSTQESINSSPSIPVLPHHRGMEPDEWERLRAHAAAHLRTAHHRLEAARTRLATTHSPRARADVARAQRAVDATRRNVLILRTIWSTAARLHEVLGARLERIEWRADGSATLYVLGKAAPGDAIAPPSKRPRVVGLVPSVAGPLREWLTQQAGGDLPTHGWLWTAGGPGQPPSALTIERYVHALAVEAGIQRVQGVRPSDGSSGEARRSHRYLVTPHAIRELAERVTIPVVGREAAARDAGHTVATQQRAYDRAGAHEALHVSGARARYA